MLEVIVQIINVVLIGVIAFLTVHLAKWLDKITKKDKKD